MAHILVLGAGIAGLGTAMLLAGDGHEVTVLERDPSPPPAPDEAAWASWGRRGVNQFRLPHLLLCRFRQICDDELPATARAIETAGALRFDYLDYLQGPPERPRHPRQPGDDDFVMLTGRRPVVEAAMAQVAESTSGVEVRRGIAVGGLLTGTSARPGVPHVSGVRSEQGEEVRGDLVVDTMGRRSPLGRLMTEAGLRPPREEVEDIGFRYYSRHFRSRDGGPPPVALLPAYLPLGSVILLTFPCDNGAWSISIVALDEDRALYGLRDDDRWTAVIRAIPGLAHWLDGDPVEDHVVTIAGLEDRHRDLVLDGRPLASGVVAVGDAWACTNPTLGRGASLALLHAQILRDQLRAVDLDDPYAFAEAFHGATAEGIYPWFTWTRQSDRHRRSAMRALLGGPPHHPDDDAWALENALVLAARHDPDCLRALVRARAVLSLLDEATKGNGLRERAFDLARSATPGPLPGPSREELVTLATA